MNDKRKFKVILIGAGQQGEKYINALRNFDFVEIKAVCCQSQSTERKIQKKYNLKVYQNYKICLRENQADLIIISVFSLIQYNIIKYLLNKTKIPLLIEKPVSYSMESIKEIFELAEKKKRIIFWNREEIYSLLNQKLKKIFNQKLPEKVLIKGGYKRININKSLSSQIENLGHVLEHALSYFSFLDFNQDNIKILNKKYDFFSGFEVSFLYQNKTVFNIKMKLGQDSFRISLKPRKYLPERKNLFDVFLLKCIEDVQNESKSFFLENKNSYLNQQEFLNMLVSDLERSEIVLLSSLCNQECLFCNAQKSKTLSLNEIKSRLSSLKEKGINHIIFSGGEPTLYPHIFKVINWAKKLKFAEIEIQTNALVCSQQFVKKLKKSGLTSAFVSLHSYKPKISDNLTGAQGNFAKTLKGINNLCKESISIIPNIVINKKNYKDLIEYVKFVMENIPTLNYISFSVVMPGGIAIDNKVVPKHSVIQPYLLKVYEYCREKGIPFIISSSGIPICLIPEFKDFSIEYKTLKFRDKRIRDSIEIDSREKVKRNDCVQCAYNNYCFGIWKNYTSLYGLTELKPINNKKDKKDQHINNILRLGLACNEKCIFCNITQRPGEEWKTLSTQEAKKKIDSFAQEPERELSFTGGEPTIRKDLFELIGYAKEKGIKRIQIQTNALVITKDYAQQLKKNGLDNAFVALTSNQANVHDKLTGLKGSYKKTLSGIDNLLKADIEVTVNIVVNKLNYQTLPEYIFFINKRFPIIELISIAVLQPHGRAKDNINLLLPKYSEIYPFIKKAIIKAKKLGIKLDNHYCGLPLCFWDENELNLSLEFEENKRIRDSYDNDLHFRIKKIIQDKKQGLSCLKCYLRNFCNCIWKDYEKVYGWTDIKPRTTLDRIIKIGDQCNNNCSNCPNKNKKFETDFKKIKDKIINSYGPNYQRIIFTGREPTLYPRLIDLIKIARKTGYKAIQIKSNGRMFYYFDFAEKMVETGLTELVIPIYSSQAKIHDRITRIPGSFLQTIEGIKNINIISEKLYPFKQVVVYAQMTCYDDNKSKLIKFLEENKIRVINNNSKIKV